MEPVLKGRERGRGQTLFVVGQERLHGEVGIVVVPRVRREPGRSS